MVLLVTLNPEMLHIAVFVDTVGIEMVLLLLEVQLLAILSAIFLEKSGSLIDCCGQICRQWLQGYSLREFTTHPFLLFRMMPGPGTVMQILVVSVLIGAVF